jgi:transposase InsO family protein
MRTQLVNDALKMAIWQRKPAKGLIWHTDRGSQYASKSHRALLKSHAIQQSMSRKGNCWDTQFRMALNVWPNLTRAGIGVFTFVLTCRLVTGVPRLFPGPSLVT